LAKIAHFSLIFTAESFCKKILREIDLFSTTQIAVFSWGKTGSVCSDIGHDQTFIFDYFMGQ
jgi:hypothetical protein